MRKQSNNRKKKQKMGNSQNKIGSGLKEETKRGIIVVLLFALALVSILAIFGLATGAGNFIDKILIVLFGKARILFPVVLIVCVVLLVCGEKYKVGKFQWLGIVLFVLSFNGLLHLTVPREQVFNILGEAHGGGCLGIILSFPLERLMGFWATFIVLIAAFIISLLLIFNISFRGIKEKLGKIFSPYNIKDKIYDWEGKILEVKDKFKSTSPSHFENKKVGEEEAPQEFYEKGKKEETRNVKKKILSPYQTFWYEGLRLPLKLLNRETSLAKSGNIEQAKTIIQRTLENFNIPVEMGEVSIGPTVTQYTLRPADGIRLSQITTLANDLSLSLAVHPIRIEAPIPGKSLMGIEVPNKTVAIVGLKEILEDSQFKKRKSNLMIALGKDVAGKCWLADLDKMPHLLIAGATGSGKTVCINSIIISLLYQNSPQELKFILVDPKRVELPIYNGIGHLLTPVITEVKATVNALGWLIQEMDRRFELLSRYHKRDIHDYNRSEEVEKLPYIILIVDELADLMAQAFAEIEAAIIRLAQMARAVGVHLIVATQRPSVDIITGLIKANITSRIAFNVASSIDSRTILDTAGAEKLLGRGDMLFSPPEFSKPKRLQGSYVSEEEIKRVVEFLREKTQPEYNEEITEEKKGQFSFSWESGKDDELLDEAKEVILEARKASASLLQRRLRIGYARAARILDILEEQGFIGPADGARPREVLQYSLGDDRIDDEEIH